MDQFMRLAFEQAQQGGAQGNMPVGSVIVDGDGVVIGRGRNRQHETGDPTSHAELEAMRDAARGKSGDGPTLFAGATCYTTMMPCAMCAGAIIRFGFSRVVVAETQSYVASGSDRLMEKNGVEVQVHQHEPCIELVARYNTEHGTGPSAGPGPGRPVLEL